MAKRQSYKQLLKLKVGEQTVLFFNEHDKEMYRRGERWACHRARQVIARAQKRSNARFTAKKGALGLLVTRLEDLPILLTHDVKKDVHALTWRIHYLERLAATHGFLNVPNSEWIEGIRKKYNLK